MVLRLAVLMLLVVAAPAQAVPVLEPLGTFTQPTYATAPPSEPDRLFVTEKPGRVQIVVDGTAQTFLDLTDITDGSRYEHGLLSIAFAPGYATSGKLYVYLTAKGPGGKAQVWEYERSATDPDVADPASGRMLLEIAHEDRTGHNGGQLQFGPDGKLWLATGDGGPHLETAQDPSSLLGKLIRLDPDDPTPEPEIVARGLRNPWRFSFAPDGTIVIADVGQSLYEEINVGLADNYGWPCREGTEPLLVVAGCTGVPLADPAFVLSHTAGFCAIVGGYVVRDPALPTLLGRYIYGDNCEPGLRSLDLADPATDAPVNVSVPMLSSFGEDAGGRILVVSLAGAVSRLVDDGTAPPPEPTPTPTPTPEPTPTPAGPGPERPPTVRDVRACAISWRVTGTGQLGRRRYLTVALRSDERCRAKITASHFSTTSVELRSGVRRSIRLRYLRRSAPRTVTVQIRAVDAAGNVRLLTKRLRVPR